MLMFIYARNISCNNYDTRLFNLIYRPQFKSNIDESCFIYFPFYTHNYFVTAAFNFTARKKLHFHQGRIKDKLSHFYFY